MNDITEFASKHPWILGIVAAVVVFIAYRQSQSDGGTTTAGGTLKSVPVDSGTVAIQTNKDNVIAGEIGAVASALLGAQQSSDALTASLAQTNAARDAAIAESNARTTQAQIAAGVQKSMTDAQLQADRERAASDARISGQSIQAQKDIARAQANAGIANTGLDVLGRILNRWF